MAITILDISKKLGLEDKVVLAKAKELSITQHRDASGSVDNITAEWLEEELIKANPAAAKFAFKPITEGCGNFGAVAAAQAQLGLLGERRRVIEVKVGLTWSAAFHHRVYSCPDTPAFDFVFGATALLLKRSNDAQRCISLNVEAVQTCDLHAPNFLETVPAKFRARLSSYKNAVQNIPGILDGDCNYRFYFLSREPWPDWLQKLADSASDAEWTAILSICAKPSCFFEWSQVGMLLWPGCTRGDENQQHVYPRELADKLLRLRLSPDPRNNGPAIMAFLAAGGIRPVCGNEGWHIHHIYDGTGPLDGVPVAVPHAVRDGNLFTHSAGLVAAHPVAHHLAHQSDLLKWLLRREAFLRFGFDPMGVFLAA